jgi:D-serine deaminase-like pyridoxal phosphate-dependent protein
MTANFLDQITTPTLVLDKNRAQANLRRMAAKAAAQGIRFRPHFKTHLSAEIGEWFRAEGVTAITVSSIRMAAYFAAHGWNDILVAFPVNLREMDAIRALAEKVRLGLLVESVESVERLAAELPTPVDIWIKIDSGMHRAGLDAREPQSVLSLARAIQRHTQLRLRGLLTHAGQTYHAHSPQEIREMYTASVQAMNDLRTFIAEKLGVALEVSVGDTPGCTLNEDLGEVDEVHPGNFIFYDAMMHDLGVCTWEDVAVAVACPVVALHPARSEAVIYGGSIHLSKELIEADGQAFYGYAAFPAECGWTPGDAHSHVVSLSQEHGVVRLAPQDFQRLNVGDLLYILPVHSCLVVEALKSYRCLDGSRIRTLNSCDPEN